MKKLTRKDLETSFINLEFSKLDLIALLYMYALGSDGTLDDSCFSPQEGKDLENSLNRIKDAVEIDSFGVSAIEQKMQIKQLLYKLLAVTESSIANSIKH